MTPDPRFFGWRREARHIHETVAKPWLPWTEEDRRHLALALAGEVGEALNLIKKDWRGDAGTAERRVLLAEELADIRIYLELLAAACSVDLDAECRAKVQALYRRWPEARPSSGAS